MALYSSADIRSFKIGELRSLLILVFSLAVAYTASASSQGIDFSFQTFNDSVLRHQGNATYDSSGFIQITEANRDKNFTLSVGWATYHEPMRLWDKASGNVANFTTQFTFYINSLNQSFFADGMTFFLVPEGSKLPPRSGGGSLAILNPFRDPSDSSAKFVAVEFDTYNNGMPMDPDCPLAPHIGIDLNNLTSAVSRCDTWFCDNIMGGRQMKATITYDSSTQNLSVLVMDADPKGNNPYSLAIYHIVNLTEYLPEWVTFGFSAATGDVFEMHTIRAWEFRSTVQVAETNMTIPTNGTKSPVPANDDAKKSMLWLWSILGSGSFILLILVLACIWFLHRSKSKRADTSGEEDDPAID